MSDQADFFVDGGTLLPEASSYVTRPADQELHRRVLNGEFCYVLTARQMGKSSLMVRSAQALRETGFQTALIDLTTIGAVAIEQWYLGLLRTIRSELGLGSEALTWWREHQDLGAPQRFFEVLHNVVLREVAGSVAIFVDEIDTTLSLDFRDDFFAAIRAMYNARASNPIFKRLTFVLLGVATPTDLIRDQRRTPFNIGSRIELRDFSYDDAAPLFQGLEAVYHGQGDRILRRIFHWTNGHPYLTQRLCLISVHQQVRSWSDEQVDRLVESTFFADAGRSDRNIAFIHERMQDSSTPERQRLLTLYQAVVSGIPVANDDRSAAQNYLELVGLVRVEKGRVQTRNRIYSYVFDQEWVQSLLPAEIIAEPLPEAPEKTLLGKETEPPAPAAHFSQWSAVAVAVALIALVLAVAFLLFNRSVSTGNANATSTANALALTQSAASPTAIAPTTETSIVVAPPTKALIDTPTFVVPTDTPVIPTNTPAPPTYTPVPVTDTPTSVPSCILARSLSVRSAPSGAAPVIDTMSAGDFRPLARNEDGFWLRVQGSSGRIGWISASAEFVSSCNFDVRQLPVVNTPAAAQATPTPTTLTEPTNTPTATTSAAP